MATAGKFRADAARMREFARTVTDPEILAEIEAMIEETERRARLHNNGDGGTEASTMLPADRAPGDGVARPGVF